MFDIVSGDHSDGEADFALAAVQALRSASAVRAAADAVELRSIAELAKARRAEALDEAAVRPDRRGRVDLDLVDRCTAQEVSVAMRVSPVVARDRLELALELVERRPATFDALRTGTIDLVRARRMADAVRALPPGPADAVEQEVLVPGSRPDLADRRPGPAAGDLTPGQLAARLARLVLRADPHGASARTEAADQRRGCTLRALPDGMALLSVTGRGELLSAAFARIDATARALERAPGRRGEEPTPAGEPLTGPTPGADAPRSLDQRRVDVLRPAPRPLERPRRCGARQRLALAGRTSGDRPRRGRRAG